MKKMFLLLAALCFAVSACMTPAATAQPQAVGPAPLSDADIQATVALSVEQTLQSLPTPTLAPSNTPVVMTVTSTPTQPTPTPTQNSALLTLTATLATGTVTSTAGPAGTLPFTATPSLSPNPAFSVTPTGTNQYQYYGTMPPKLPSGYITMINMSKSEAYVSLQCTTKDGYVTIIEYPVGGSRVSTSAVAGKYVYVASVGGKKMTGNFRLGESQDLTLIIYKDRIEIK
jgi:hypothetical protein